PAFLGSVAWCAGRNRRARFALGAFAVLMLVAFGRFTPFFAFLFKVFPVVRLVRYPVKLVVPSAMLVAISAGWGFETLRQPPEDWPARKRSLVWALAALAVVLGACWLVAWAAPDWVRASGSWLAKRAAEAYSERTNWNLSVNELGECGEYFLEGLRLYLPELLGSALGAVMWLKVT